MAWKVLDIQTGEEISFKYRDFGVSGKPVVNLGKYEMPVVEFVGVVVQHLRQDFPRNDYRWRWKAALTNISFKCRIANCRVSEPVDWYIDFSGVHREIEAEVIPFRALDRTLVGVSPKIKKSPEGFEYGDYCIGPREFCDALEYFFSNYYFANPEDPRLTLFEALIPAWYARQIWQAETTGATGESRQREAREKRKEFLSKYGKVSGSNVHSLRKASPARSIVLPSLSSAVFIVILIVTYLLFLYGVFDIELAECHPSFGPC